MVKWMIRKIIRNRAPHVDNGAVCAHNDTREGKLFMRLLLLVMSVMLTSVACANAGNKNVSTTPYSKSPTKHAVLVMDADTKKVLYHENGYDRRFPASLTKMMTLYMAFDAMRQGKLKTGTTMKASRLAAKQQQTNIGMKHGYKISVDRAIKSLVVRSANDVAVVFAEKLGGNVDRFATMMTQKAQSLGMRHTVFKNPHGLPNSKQYSTAYDMAILGVALRRDFPQYYHYFSTTQFTYNKKTFKTHNHVLKDFAHVDGIKTGYIRASGFNVVSSAQKDGFNIVAAVMGGASSRARDGYMKETLNRTFATLKKQKRSTRQMARAPKPYKNPRRKTALQQHTVAKINVEVNAIPTAIPVSAKKQVVAPKSKPALSPKERRFEPQVKAPVVKENLDFAALIDEPKPVLKPKAVAPKKVVAKAKPIPQLIPKKLAQAPKVVAFTPKETVAPKPAPRQIARVAPSAKISITNITRKSAKTTAVAPKGTLDFQLSKLSTSPKAAAAPSQGQTLGTLTRRVQTQAPAYNPTKEWGIQVGAFKDENTAKRALSRAFKLVRDEAKGAKVDIATQGGQQQAAIHRARLGNLSRKQAHHICQKLQSLAQACFPLRVN